MTQETSTSTSLGFFFGVPCCTVCVWLVFVPCAIFCPIVVMTALVVTWCPNNVYRNYVATTTLHHRLVNHFAVLWTGPVSL